MPDLGALADLHFLRPLWLWVVPAALLLWLILRRRSSIERQWRKVMAPHLLAHLKVGAGGGWTLRPRDLLGAGLVLGGLALAGPTWEREASPFAEETAPLVVALDLSRSMNAVDVQPTRLERAKQKVRDLLGERRGARTALIAYAGSAHTVLPLCDDPAIFETFLAALETDVMPMPGKEPALALALAEELLAVESTPGSILFLTDGIAAEQVAAFREHAGRSEDEVLVLAVGTRQGGPVRTGDDGFETDAAGRRIVSVLDVVGLEALAAEAGVFVGSVTVDNGDVRRIQRRVQSHLEQVRQKDETARWKDQGYWLTLPIALIAILSFRRGWTVRWANLVLALLITSGCGAREGETVRFVDLWLTADQQGRLALERGDPAMAAERFADPMWKGAAHYRAGEFEAAAESFGRLPTAEASFNLGNAWAMLGRYEEALAAYEAAIVDRPDWQSAIDNRDAVQALIAAEIEPPEEDQTAGEPSLPPDEIQFDEKGEKGTAGEIEVEQLTDEQLAEMWLRRLQSSPGDFLRQRFAVEAAMAGAEGGQ